MTRISLVLTEVLPWVLIGVLVFNMSQRRHMDVGVRKRYATLWIAGLLGSAWGAAIAFKRFGVPDVFLIAVAAAVGAVAWLKRGTIFAYRLRCSECRKPLPLERVLYHDDTRCPSCQGGGKPAGDSQAPPS